MAETQEDQHEDTKRVRVACRPFERAVFIDCTWNQTRNIIQDERLKGRFCADLILLLSCPEYFRHAEFVCRLSGILCFFFILFFKESHL